MTKTIQQMAGMLPDFVAAPIFEKAGIDRLNALYTAIDAVRRGGTCVVVGLGPQDQQVTFNPLELFHFSRTLVSSIYGNSDARRDIEALLPHVADGSLDLTATITDRIALADVPAAFERMQRGEGGRALVVFPSDLQEEL